MVGRHVVVAGVGVADLLGAQGGRHGAAPYTRAPCPRLPTLGLTAVTERISTDSHQPIEYLQRDQPEGVPPLALTGERTLPDVPEENYWYRRHLVVYEWIAARVRGVRVIDMACGEGYGSDVLARTAASVVGVDANPEAHEHARLRYGRANLRFERDAGRKTFAEPADAVVFLQTIEHLQDPGAVLEHFRSLLGDGGTVFLSTPNVLTLAPKGAAALGQPLARPRVPPARVRATCAASTSARSRCTACSTRASCASTSSRCALGWDRVHPRAAA